MVSEAALSDKFCSASYATPSYCCFARPKEERRHFSDLAVQLRQLPVQSDFAVGHHMVQAVRSHTAAALAQSLGCWLRFPDWAAVGPLLEDAGVSSALNRLAVKCVIFHALSRATHAPVELIRCASEVVPGVNKPTAIRELTSCSNQAIQRRWR